MKVAVMRNSLLHYLEKRGGEKEAQRQGAEDAGNAGNGKVAVTCRSCGYQWRSQGRMIYVRCPYCRKTTPRTDKPWPKYKPKISERDKAQIVKKRRAGRTQRELAEQYGVSITRIVQILYEAERQGEKGLIAHRASRLQGTGST